jgi:hypothetical protein
VKTCKQLTVNVFESVFYYPGRGKTTGHSYFLSVGQTNFFTCPQSLWVSAEGTFHRRGVSGEQDGDWSPAGSAGAEVSFRLEGVQVDRAALVRRQEGV